MRAPPPPRRPAAPASPPPPPARGRGAMPDARPAAALSAACVELIEQRAARALLAGRGGGNSARGVEEGESVHAQGCDPGLWAVLRQRVVKSHGALDVDELPRLLAGLRVEARELVRSRVKSGELAATRAPRRALHAPTRRRARGSESEALGAGQGCNRRCPSGAARCCRRSQWPTRATPGPFPPRRSLARCGAPRSSPCSRPSTRSSTGSGWRRRRVG